MLRSCAAAIRSAVLAELDRQLAASTEHLETMSSDALASLANLLASRVTLCEAALARRRNGAVGSSSASAPPASWRTGGGAQAQQSALLLYELPHLDDQAGCRRVGNALCKATPPRNQGGRRR